MSEPRKSFCRVCINQCSIEVDVESGLASEIRGDTENPVYGGYTCIKGRSQNAYLRDPSRLRRSLRRGSDGSHEPIDIGVALEEIAAKLTDIRERYGPRAIAGYAGTMAMVTTAPTSIPFYNALLDAIGTPMRFDPNTIDKGGKQTAQSFLGYWQAPSQGFDRPEAILLIGINPWLTHTGFPAGSPKRWLADTMSGGCKLIVIDPRRTQVARLADWHLQVRPGNDVGVLAAMIKVIVEEELYDHRFASDHVRGFAELGVALETVDIGSVADAADITAEDLIGAARCYARARRGYAMAGTGPNMSGSGTLVEYLVLVLETLCGRWLRAGEKVTAAPTLLPATVARAQAKPPDRDWALEGRMRIRGLRESRAGMPTAALAEEILTPGDGRVRALVSWGGNPAVAFPDQRQTVSALRALDLFVQVDPWYSESARIADYVIAPTMPLEVPSTTVFLDSLSGRATGYGLGRSYAQYSPAIVDRPDDSDLIEEWQFFLGLMRSMGYETKVRPFAHGMGAPAITIAGTPTTDELIALLSTGSRVPLTRIKGNPGGALYPDELAVVLPAETGANDRLDIGSAEMLGRLREWLLPSSTAPSEHAQSLDFRLLCRRVNHVYNTSGNLPVTNKGLAYNPAYLCPGDMDRLGLQEGQKIRLTSTKATIAGFAHADANLRPGLVSMAFGYGAAPGHNADPLMVGSSPSLLIAVDEVFDPYTGQPRMSNVPISIAPF